MLGRVYKQVNADRGARINRREFHPQPQANREWALRLRTIPDLFRTSLPGKDYFRFVTLRLAIHQMVPKILAEERMSPHAEMALEHSGQIL